MSYTIDIYRGKLEPTNNFIDFAVFVSFFPQLVAGPIERAASLMPQIQRRPMPSRDQVEKGIVLIVTGLFGIFFVAMPIHIAVAVGFAPACFLFAFLAYIRGKES